MASKIAFFISNLGGGGSQGVCITLFNELIKKQYDVDLVVLNLDNAVRKEKVLTQDRIINLNAKHARDSVFKIYKYIKNTNPNVVLSFNMEISIIIVVLRFAFWKHFKIISRNTTIISISELNKTTNWIHNIKRVVAQKLYSKSDIMIAQSISMANDMHKYLNINMKKIIVIHNPIQKDLIANSDEYKLNIKKSNNYLLCIGRLERTKAFHFAIEALALLKNDYSVQLKFLGEGSLEDDLKRLAQQYDLHKRVEFLGYQKELIPYYTNARLTLLTSLYEGLPNVLIESIACGTPVVAFDCPGGVSEIIEEGVNGFLVKDRDLDALVAGIEKALNYEWDKKAIMESAKKFDPERIINEYIKVLQ